MAKRVKTHRRRIFWKRSLQTGISLGLFAMVFFFMLPTEEAARTGTSKVGTASLYEAVNKEESFSYEEEPLTALDDPIVHLFAWLEER